MTDLEAILDDVARELSLAGFVQTSLDGYGVYPDGEKIVAVLKRRLLPLLEAGQVMQDNSWSEHGDGEMAERCNMCKAIVAWDAALAAAREGKP